MLELWGMRSTSSLPSLPGPLWTGVVAPDRVLPMSQRELNYVLIGLVGLVSLFNGISTLCRLFNANAILLEEQYWYYLTNSWED